MWDFTDSIWFELELVLLTLEWRSSIVGVRTRPIAVGLCRHTACRLWRLACQSSIFGSAFSCSIWQLQRTLSPGARERVLMPQNVEAEFPSFVNFATVAAKIKDAWITSSVHLSDSDDAWARYLTRAVPGSGVAGIWREGATKLQKK